MKVLISALNLVAFIFLIGCSGDIKITTKEGFEMVELPDASIVFLNKNSSITYGPDFISRTVSLNGEAFFSVTPSEDPFIVKTETCEVEVLGTEFNVKTDPESTDVEVEKGEVVLKTRENRTSVKRGERATHGKDKPVKKGRAEFKFKIWMKELRVEFKKMGREIKKGSKSLGKEIKKGGKELKKDLKKLKNK